MPQRDLLRSYRTQFSRATAPILGGILVVALTVVVATLLGTAVLGVSSAPEPSPTVAIDFTVDGNEMTFTHESGEPLDVHSISVWIAVDGEPLAEQPPVPFFSAAGFQSGPTGPFNSRSDPEWSVGETASLTVAGTNSPTIEEGSTVSVRITADGGTVIRTETQV